MLLVAICLDNFYAVSWPQLPDYFRRIKRAKIKLCGTCQQYYGHCRTINTVNAIQDLFRGPYRLAGHVAFITAVSVITLRHRRCWRGFFALFHRRHRWNSRPIVQGDLRNACI
jgi:hypothetical protein